MEQHIIVEMEFKLMLCQTGSQGCLGRKELLIDVERAARTPMNAGEQAQALSR
jgi:hypothetical protein